ncbi:MAG: Rrf2 family transcriptional regulator [Calditrichaeota bacterium]|nr:MAG: Rrf2 family transcriptional regulator [Calditrichota bacterium]
MLKLTKKSEYGIIALKHMLNQPEGEVTTAKEISTSYNIPSEIMAKILQRLARVGIVKSCQGAKGGYVLARAGESISLSEIIEVLEGPVELVGCVDKATCDCMQLENCNISDPFRIIQKQFKVFLSGISLADINNEIEMQRVVWY